jgi:hypothetical protein
MQKKQTEASKKEGRIMCACGIGLFIILLLN